MPYWADRQITINSTGSRPGRDCVEIGVDDPTTDGPALTGHYQGTFPVCVDRAGGAVPLVAPSPTP